MKRPAFLAGLVAAAVIGFVLASAIHSFRYGGGSRFHVYDMDGTVRPVDIRDHYILEAEEGGPEVEIVNGAIHDFGKMSVGDTGKHTFVVRNIGDEPLTLQIGETTCKCTVGSLKADSLAPGEETEVELEWTVKTTAAEFSQTAELITNDLNHHKMPLRVSGRVTREFEVVPEGIAFGSILFNESVDRFVNVFVYADYEIVPEEARITNDDINEHATIEIEELDIDKVEEEFADASQGFRLNIHLDPGIPQGTVSQNVVFSFRRVPRDGQTDMVDSDGTPVNADDVVSIAIPIKGDVVGKLRMVTSTKLRPKTDGGYMYLYNALPADQPTETKMLVMLKSPDREKLKLKIDEVYPSIVSAELGEPKHQKTMTLVPLMVTISPEGQALDYRGMSGSDKDYGRIVLSTDDEDNATMAVYLKFQTDAD